MPATPAARAAAAGARGSKVEPRDRGVRRTRLLAEVAAAPDRTVIVVSGPAGAGKSTLIRQLLDADDRPRAVVRLAGHDDEPTTLAGLLVDALEGLGAPAPGTRASITGVEPRFSAVLLPALTQLAASRSPFLLVLDDVHLLRGHQCQDILAAVAQGVPVGSCLVLATRDDVPERLAHARAQGHLLEIGPRDLALDVRETEELLLSLDLLLPKPAIAELVERSEGWAVGVYLTALALSRDESPSVDPTWTGSGRSEKYIRDYLRTEVLYPMSLDERSFLTQTAVLDDLSVRLCNAVTRRSDSGALLVRLQRQSQLVTAIGGDAFRCHHLLREVLLLDLACDDAELVPELHARAAHWYADEGADLDAAVRHAKAARNLSLVAELIWSDIIECIAGGTPERLGLWLGGLSEHDISSDPWLSQAAAWSALQAGDSDRMGHWLLRCEAHAGRDWRQSIESDPFAAHLAVLEALVCDGGLEDSVTLTDAALAGLPADSGFRAVAGFLNGVGHTLLNRPEQGRRRIREAEFLARALSVPIIQADTLSWQGTSAVLAGDTVHGAELIGEATRLIEANHLDRLASSAHVVTAQALLHALTHHPDAATTLGRARSLTALVRDIAPWFAVSGRVIQARAAILLGDGAQARALLAEARRHMTPDLTDSLLQGLLEATAESLQSLAQHRVAPAALTAAEMRVLQFMPSYLSLPQIGEHLFLSTNTVKTHALAIYRKFGVTSRSEAVELARSLGLVDGPIRD